MFKNEICQRCGDTAKYHMEGKTVTFGSYPQSMVSDSILTSTLNARAGALPAESAPGLWTSYGYFVNGSVASFMWYIDLTVDGGEYRGVYFTSYRPYFCTGEATSAGGHTYQDENGFSIGTVYWFKYEPITWTVISKNNNEAMLLCNMIIDSSPFDYKEGTGGVNNYEQSTIRAWLNSEFMRVAFSDEEQKIILDSLVDNSLASTGSEKNPYTCSDTTDKVFLLSVKEAIELLKSSTLQQKQATDYAKCQGIYVYHSSQGYDGNSWWW
jgi:hypothetical protein